MAIFHVANLFINFINKLDLNIKLKLINLEIKYKKLEQRKERLQQTQARLKLQERKAKITQYIKLGQLVEFANLNHLDESILLGDLLSLKSFLEDAPTILEWKKMGDKASQEPSVTSDNH